MTQLTGRRSQRHYRQLKCNGPSNFASALVGELLGGQITSDKGRKFDVDFTLTVLIFLWSN